MGREERGGGSVRPGQAIEEARHALGGDARAGEGVETGPVRVLFLRSREFQFGEPAEILEERGCIRLTDEEAHQGEQAARIDQLTHRVAVRGMSHLVGEDARHFLRGLRLLDEAGVHHDQAAGGREGVRLPVRLNRHPESEALFGARGLEPLQDEVDGPRRLAVPHHPLRSEQFAFEHLSHLLVHGDGDAFEDEVDDSIAKDQQGHEQKHGKQGEDHHHGQAEVSASPRRRLGADGLAQGPVEMRDARELVLGTRILRGEGEGSSLARPGDLNRLAIPSARAQLALRGVDAKGLSRSGHLQGRAETPHRHLDGIARRRIEQSRFKGHA